MDDGAHVCHELCGITIVQHCHRLCVGTHGLKQQQSAALGQRPTFDGVCVSGLGQLQDFVGCHVAFGLPQAVVRKDDQRKGLVGHTKIAAGITGRR